MKALTQLIERWRAESARLEKLAVQPGLGNAEALAVMAQKQQTDKCRGDLMAAMLDEYNEREAAK